MTAELGQTILAQVGVVEQQLVWINVNVMNGQSKGHAEMQKLWRVTNNNIRAFGGRIQGARARQRASNQGVWMVGEDVDDDKLVQLQEARPTTLSNTPHSLNLLRQEHKFGINDRKPAEQFTPNERNMPDNKQLAPHCLRLRQ